MVVTLKDALRITSEAGYKTVSPGKQKAERDYAVNKDKWSEKHFTMQDTKQYETIRNQLTQGQKGVLLLLTTTMVAKKGGKLYKGRNERLTIEDVARMIGRERRQTYEILVELEQVGAITKEQVGRHVCVNIVEDFYLCGFMEKKRPVVKIFKKRLQEVAKLLTLNELGFLADVLSHIHWTTHILCSNPTEPDISKLEVWRGKDIVEVLGYSRNFVSATLRKFKRNGITMEIGTYIDVICIDPELVHRSAKEITILDIKNITKEIAFSNKNYRGK